MPGVCGLVGVNTVAQKRSYLPAMLDALSYGRCRASITYAGQSVAMGRVGLGQPGQQITGSWYDGDAAVVSVQGYVVSQQRTDHRPEIGARQDEAHSWHSARHVYDQYARLGTACIEQLDGAFSVAIWDKVRQRLVLATDRFGLQPLYYTDHGCGLLFASELKAVLQIPGVGRDLDEAAVADFFSFGYILGDRTFVQGIQLVSPASILIYQDSKWSKHSYWQLAFPDSYPKRANEYYDELLYDAVAGALDEVLEPDGRYGVPLSGGMDSRWMAALLSQKRPDTLAMTFGLDGCDDLQIATQVAEQLGMEHVWIPVTEDAIIKQMDGVSYATDGMFNVFHANEFPLSRVQPDHVDVSVGGFLGDVLSSWEVNPRTMLLTERSVVPYLYRKLRPSSVSDDDLARLFGRTRYARLEQSALQSLQDSVVEVQSSNVANGVSAFYIRQRERRRTFVGQLLKQSYITARYPFSHRRFAESALNLPVGQRIVEQAYRRSFVKHFPSLGSIPWERTMGSPGASWFRASIYFSLRKKLRPSTMAKRPQRFTVLRAGKRSYADYDAWIQGDLGQYVESVLLGPDSNPLQLFNGAYVRELFEAQVAGRRDVIDFVGLLLTFELWSRRFLGLSPAPDLPAAPEIGGSPSDEWKGKRV